MSPDLSPAGLAVAFGAGLASFVSPCTLPLVPSYLSFITGASLSDLRGEGAASEARGRAVRHSLMFVLGFSIVFTLLGLGASALGQRLREVQPIVTKVGGVLLIILGLHYMRVIRIAFLDMEKKAHLKEKPAGYLGSLLVGVVFSAGYSPCVGPLLAGILLLAAGATTAGAVALLAAYCLGFGLPFIGAALAVDRFLVYSTALKRNMTAVLRVSGALLVVVGVAMYMNWLTLLIPGQGPVFTAESPVKHITGAEFEREVLRSDLPVLMDVSATWCTPCKELAPIVERLARDKAGELKVVTIDFDRNRSLVERYGVLGLPNLVTFRGGKKVGDNLQGVMPYDELRKRVEGNLGEGAVADRAGPEAAAAPKRPREVVRVEVPDPGRAFARGGRFSADIVLSIAPGYHVNANPASSEDYIPTMLNVDPKPGIRLDGVDYPRGEPRRFAFSDGAISVYEGRTTLRLQGRVAPDAQPGEHLLSGTLTYQACNDQTCLLPRDLPVTLRLKVSGG